MPEYSELEQKRIVKLQRLRARGEEPYPLRVERTHTIAEAHAVFEAAIAAGADSADTGESATLCGRMRALRPMGKTAFAHIEDGTGRIQLMLRAAEVGRERLKQLEKDFDLGDFVQARGVLVRTRTGEVTLRTTDIVMLAKSIRPLPAQKEVETDGERVVYSAFDNPEARYRERYADLALNPDVRAVFRKRAQIFSALREFMDEHGFLEVETPILQPIYGGAAARPFVTHHNQLHQDLYLRIAYELYLKRLLVGGFDAVYEIGRDFRNEGVDRTHNPEFTQLEFYWAYHDYRDVMELTEQLVSTVAEQVLGTTEIIFQEQTVELKPPWARITLHEAVLDMADIDFNAYPTAESLATAMRAKGLESKPDATRGKLIEDLLNHFVEPRLIQPTFIYDYPRDISPFAKRKIEDPNTVERFEGFIVGMEMCNAFTELNDPLDQEQRFIEASRDFDPDAEEAHPMDEDYLRAMSYGMPPNGGFGMGLDRLVMLLTDKPNIREVILFPHLRKRSP